MTKRTMNWWFCAAIFYFSGLILLGMAISYVDRDQPRLYYQTFKDLIPFLIAIPAAWLSFCSQRRSAYLQQIRSLWSKLIDSVQGAAQYADMTNRSVADQAKVLLKLSVVIDEFRGVFCNIGETSTHAGYYPFEPLKDIYSEVAKLSLSEACLPEEGSQAKERIFALWKEVRQVLLKEFDREEPRNFHSYWADKKNAKVYEQYGIQKGSA